MIILGLDPGTATTGYGVIRMTNFKISCVAYGAIITKPDMDMPQRLSVIYDDLGQIIRQYHPDEVAVEKLYFGKNITTGISVGQARGVLLLRLAQEIYPSANTPRCRLSRRSSLRPCREKADPVHGTEFSQAA